VPGKGLRIGVKNHGLKTCFTIGDEIVIDSDGTLSKQTLYHLHQVHRWRYVRHR
jgi:hypothetical protein